MSGVHARRWGWLVGALVLLLAQLAPTAEAAKQLRWKVKAGDRFDVVMGQEMRQEIQAADMTIVVPQTMTTNMTWTVERVDDEGLIHMAQTIDRLRVKVDSAEFKVDFDSANADAQLSGPALLIANQLKPLVGASFIQRMNDRGQVLSVEAPKEAEAIIKANPALGGQSLTESIGRLSPAFPAEALDQGSQWKQSGAVQLPFGKMVIESTYAYRGEAEQQGRTLDEIGVAMTVAIEPGEAAIARVTIAEQEANGKLLFDSAAGRLHGSDVTQVLKMNIEVFGQKTTTKVTSQTTLSVTPAKPAE